MTGAGRYSYEITVEFPRAVQPAGPGRWTTQHYEKGTVRLSRDDPEGARDALASRIVPPAGCTAPGTVLSFTLTPLAEGEPS